jgi:hypothetical protein
LKYYTDKHNIFFVYKHTPVNKSFHVETSLSAVFGLLLLQVSVLTFLLLPGKLETKTIVSITSIIMSCIFYIFYVFKLSKGSLSQNISNEIGSTEDEGRIPTPDTPSRNLRGRFISQDLRRDLEAMLPQSATSTIEEQTD